jgi:cytochrome c oxidase cbb3-type subunit II
MKRGPILFIAIFLTMALSWGGLILAPQIQLGGQQPAEEPGTGAIYPAARAGLAQQGREVYRAQGCYYCHTQQVRPQGFGSDYERTWGARHSVAADYLFDYPVMLGRLRMGPDLANIGNRQTNQLWHLVHLYDPSLTVRGSTKPSYSFLFEKRPIRRGGSPEALPLPPDRVELGYEVVPTPQARALAAYLLSLKKDVALFEAPFPPEPAPREWDRLIEPLLGGQ